MKNMNGSEKMVREMNGDMGEGNTASKMGFDKEKAYQIALNLSTKVNFWGEGLYKNEEWSF